MARRVFVHIGAPKTGTTFLQSVMWQNRRLLVQQGLFYPGGHRFDHFLVSQFVREIATGTARPSDAWERLSAAIRAWDGDALLSHEFFCAASEERAGWLIDQLAPAEVQIIFTARDYVRQIPGVWQEAVKMGSVQSFDDFVDGAVRLEKAGVWSWLTQDAPSILGRWGRHLDPGHVNVITVPPRGAPRDLLWNRWCDVVGIDPAALDLDVARSNQLLGAPQAALLQRVLHQLPDATRRDGPTMHRWFRAYLAEEVLAPQQGERFGVGGAQAERLVELSHEAVAVIDRSAYRVIGDLAELIPDLAAAPALSPDDATDGELLEAAVTAIEQMLRDVQQITTDRDSWKRKARLARQAVRRQSQAPPPSGARRAAGAVKRRLRSLATRVTHRDG